MSRSWSHFKSFHCTNGCEAYGGCPGHRMRLVFYNTSDTLVVQVDPPYDDVNAYSNPKYGDFPVYDDDSFHAMVDLAIEMRAKWARDHPTHAPNADRWRQLAEHYEAIIALRGTSTDTPNNGEGE